MKPLLLAIPFAAYGMAAQAQDVLFQSGEHEDFTRLVATLPTPDTDWTITRTGNGYKIKIDGDDLNLRTSGIFDRIPKTRLAAVSANSATGEVDLELACDCRIVSIPYNDRYVIFDIRNGSPEVEAIEETPQIPLSFGEAVPTQKQLRSFRFSSLEATKPVVAMAEAVPEPQPDSVEAPDFSGLLALENFVNRNQQVTLLRQDLIKQVDRAATQDLLDAAPLPVVPENPAPPIELATGPQFKTPEAQVVKPNHVPPQAAIGLEGGNLNIIAYNVIDEVGRDIAALLNGQVGMNTCLPDTAVNISAWSGEKPFSQELAQLRRDVVGEFDRTNEDALKTLAKLYIHYTFGAEAVQVLNLLPDSAENDILKSMARLVDGEQLPASENAFANQGHCSGHVALWAALSGQPVTGDSAAKGAQDALAAMPRHLREYLGPELSNRFVSQGDTESATLTLNAIDRTSTDPGTRYDFAEATLQAELGNTEVAEETLTEIATQNSDMATFAIVDLIESHVAQGVAPSGDTTALVGALAVEHKAGAMGPSLRRAHALARMLEQDYEPAFAIVREIEDHDGPEAAVAVRTAVTESLIANAEGFDVLAFTLEEDLSEPGKVTPNAALLLAETMFDLGFMGETRRLLQAAQNAHDQDLSRILKAKVALADNLPRRAEAEILGLETPEAKHIRAKARSMAGDHAEAAAILAELGEANSAETQNWLGGNMEALAESETEVYRQASELLQRGTAALENDMGDGRVTQGMLAQNRSLIENSLESRSVLDNLLNWHSLTESASTEPSS